MDPQRRRSRPLVVRRDADGQQRAAPSWESLTERLIREAQEAGRFDDLPGRGRPLALADDAAAGAMALAHHVLRNAGMAPPWIEADKEVRAVAERIEATLCAAASAPPAARARLRGRLLGLADEHDRAVVRLASLAPTPRQHRRALDRATLIARLDEAFERDSATHR